MHRNNFAFFFALLVASKAHKFGKDIAYNISIYLLYYTDIYMPSLTLSSLVYTPDFVGSTPHSAREEKKKRRS